MTSSGSVSEPPPVVQRCGGGGPLVGRSGEMPAARVIFVGAGYVAGCGMWGYIVSV